MSKNGAETRAVLYARVSGDDRGKDGRNLAGQLEMGRTFAEAKGWNVIAELAEDERGASGADLDLPQLSRAIDMAREGEFDVLVVRELDRLARGLAKQLIVEARFRRQDVNIVYVLGEYPDTPEGNLMKNVRAVVAEYERLKIAERSKRGRRLKAKNGKWPCDGHAPYGYKKVGEKSDARLAVNEEEAAVVRRIYRMYIGRDNGQPMTQVAICEALMAEGISPPNRGKAINPKYASDTWHRNTVRKILTHPRYLGEFNYGGIDVPLPDLAIVDRELFEAAQERRERGRSRTGQERKYDYLLVGYIKCSCGASMSGKPMKRGRYLYYKCNEQQNSPHAANCEELLINASDADAIVWTWIKGKMTNEEELELGLKRMLERQESNLQPKQEELEETQSLIEEAERKIKRLAKGLADAENESVADAVQGELKAAGRQRDVLVARRERLEAQLSREQLTAADIEAVKALAAEVRRKMDDPTIEQRRSLLHRLGVEVELRWKDGERGIDCSSTLELESSAKQNGTPGRTWMSLEGVCTKSSSTTTT